MNRVFFPPGSTSWVIAGPQQGKCTAGRAHSLTAGEVHGSFANQQTNTIPREAYCERKALDQDLAAEVPHGFQGKLRAPEVFFLL